LLGEPPARKRELEQLAEVSALEKTLEEGIIRDSAQMERANKPKQGLLERALAQELSPEDRRLARILWPGLEVALGVRDGDLLEVLTVWPREQELAHILPYMTTRALSLMQERPQISEAEVGFIFLAHTNLSGARFNGAITSGCSRR
jgi:hypothetical protein